MSKYLLIGALILGVAVVVYIGCDNARLNVVGDQAIKKIDQILGEINVKQKEVEMAYEKLESAMANVREKRIEAQVRVKQMSEKQTAMDEKMAKIQKNLGKLRDMIKDAESEGFIEKDGKKIEISQLKTLAESGIRELKNLKDEINRNTVISIAWAKNLTVLKKQEDTSTTQLAKLSNQLDEIRSKKTALDAMKEAATIPGAGESINDKFDDLTKSVDELMVSIDTKFQVEELKLDDRAAAMSESITGDIDDILNDKTDVSGTLSELDKVLGNDK